MFRTDAVIPPDPGGLDVLHDRDYRVRAYKLADDRLLIPGAVRARRHPVHANLNTCHVWAEDGEQVARIRDGRPMEVPLTMQRRLQELGRCADEWPGFAR